MPDGERRFTGFGPRALDFFRALAFHQSKPWFDANRALYEDEVRTPFVALVADLTSACAAADLPVRGDARSLFRLNRDIRFSKDKRPYKTNAGAVLTRDGGKRSPGLLYVHVDPEGCFAAAGFYHPEPAELLTLRRAVRDRPAVFRAAVKALAGTGLALGEGDALSRLPKGFETVDDPELAAAIRMRNLVVRRPIADDSLHGAALVGEIVDFARDALPLLRFGWSALDRGR